MKKPLSGKINSAATVAYGFFVLWSLLIFLTIPFARTLQKYVAVHFGRSAFGYAMLALIGGGLLGTFYIFKKKHADRLPIRHLIWIAAVGGAYVYFTVHLWKTPEEAIHFLEYAVLGYFAYAALRFHVKDYSIFFTASLMILFVGTVDEIIQWLVPGRYWDIRDVGFNFLGGALLQIAIYKGATPQNLSRSIHVPSVRIFSVVLGACLVLIGLCASNTPARIAFYSEKIPFLSYLQTNYSMMSDYGYKHKDSEIGTFYSRFTRKQLRMMDHIHKEKYSKILNKTFHDNYGNFLKTYSPFTTPFLYEMRIHLFRRDRYAALAGRGDRSGSDLKDNSTIAFKENLILEKYFSETLNRSRYQWSVQKTDTITSHADTGAFYRSPVSSDLFTLFTNGQLWGLILCLLLILGGVNLRMGRGR